MCFCLHFALGCWGRRWGVVFSQTEVSTTCLIICWWKCHLGSLVVSDGEKVPSPRPKFMGLRSSGSSLVAGTTWAGKASPLSTGGQCEVWPSSSSDVGLSGNTCRHVSTLRVIPQVPLKHIFNLAMWGVGHLWSISDIFHRWYFGGIIDKVGYVIHQKSPQCEYVPEEGLNNSLSATLVTQSTLW